MHVEPVSSPVWKKPMNAIAGSAELISCSMIRRHAGETRRIDVSALVPCLQVLRGLATLPGLQVPWAFQVKLDIADDGNLKALLLPCPADQMLMWENLRR
jgi:hypothetical protein